MALQPDPILLRPGQTSCFGGSEMHVLVAYDAIVVTDVRGSKFQTEIDQNWDFAGTNIEALISIRWLLGSLGESRASLRNLSPVAHSHSYLLARDCISGFVAALLLGKIFNAPGRYLWVFGLGGAATVLVRTSFVLLLGADLVTSTFLSAAAITVVTVVLSRRHLLLPALFAVICVLTMTPGFLMVSGLNDCFALSRMAAGEIPHELLAATVHSILRAGFIVFAMITGVVFPVLVLDGRTPRV